MKNNVYSGKPILVYESGFDIVNYKGMLSCVMGFKADSGHRTFALFLELAV